MKAPISWLKEYVEIKSNLKSLMWKLTEVGLTCENYLKINGEEVLDMEVTPNRPDWLSIVGIAREISVIENSRLNLPKTPPIPKPSASLPIKIKIHPKLVGRYTAITIKGVQTKASPDWMIKRLKLMGLRPINNLVDITNYVMFELGIPIHVFDYDKFLTKELSIELSQGGEDFTSVDGIPYKLPKNALIIKDKERVIDLCGIKGGENTGISTQTKNIFIHIPIYSPVNIRKTSQALNLASDASYIYERGPDLGGTITSLKRTVSLVLKHAGGKVASEIIDIKDKECKPKNMSISFNELTKNLGLDLEKKQVLKILSKLGLSPKTNNDEIILSIPTYRSDLNIKEDIFEEVARIYGYNNFPKTLPSGSVATYRIPYFYDRDFEMFLKEIMVLIGYTEINTLALTSEETILKANLDIKKHIKIANPVSKEYEYLRTSLIPNLLLSIKLNPSFDNLRFFEYNKIYLPPLDNAQEKYVLSGIEKGGSYESIKGVIETILNQLNIEDFDIKPFALANAMWHPIKAGVLEKDNLQIGTLGEIHPKVLDNFEVKGKLYAFELEVDALKKLKKERVFKGIPKYPAQIENLSLVIPPQIKVGDVIKIIRKSHKYVSSVELIDKYEKAYTFRIQYQHPRKTLTDKEVEEVRKKFLRTLEEKYSVRIKSRKYLG